MLIRKSIRNTAVILVSAVLAVMAWSVCVRADEVFAADPEVIWGRYQNSLENNGVTSRKTPENRTEAFIRWGVKFSDALYGSDSFTPPIIIGDVLYTASKNKVYALDKKTGERIRVSGVMAGNVDFAMNPLEYDAEHKQIYVPVTEGRVVCLKADENAADPEDKLRILWTSKKYTNAQAVSPVVYRDGYVYTGTYAGPSSDGVYFCLDCETGATNWEMRPSQNGGLPSGFYWAGAYVSPSSSGYMVFGSDDGTTAAISSTDPDYPETAVLYSVSKSSGSVIDTIRNCRGSIKSTAVYHNGYIYWVSKGGLLYKVKMNANGTFDKSTLASVRMPDDGMMTSAPVVYNRRIYVGVAGTGGQFTADGGHMLAVIDDNKLNKQNADALIYTTQIAGYAQAAPVLSTATEQTDGKVRVYFTFNAPPGGIYYLEDSSSSTSSNHKEAELLFEPEEGMKEYNISPIAVDSDGTMYIKNDSGYLMAVERNEVYLNCINVYSGDAKLLDKNSFEESRRDYKLRAQDDADQISFELSVPDGMTAYINGESYAGGKKNIAMPDTSLSVEVEVRRSGNSRKYNVNIVKASNNANLADVKISDSGIPVALSNEFDPGQTSIITEEIGIPEVPVGDVMQNFVALRVTTEDPELLSSREGKIEVKPYQFVGTKYNSEGNIDKEEYGDYYPIYWTIGQNSMTVVVTVTASNGKTKKDYYVTFLRSDEAVEFGRKNRYITIVDEDGEEGEEPLRQMDKQPLLLSSTHVDLYTHGAGQTYEIRAFVGSQDITRETITLDDDTQEWKYDQWESTDKTLVTVSGQNGKVFLNSHGKEGEAVVWLESSKYKLRAHVNVTISKPTADKPAADIESGRYTDSQTVTLTTLSEGSEIRYNIGVNNENITAPESTSGTVYDGSISLDGEEGKKTTYYIKAIATGGDYFTSNVTTLRYVIDRRTPVDDIEVDEIDAPVSGEPFAESVSVSDDRIRVKGLTWFEVGADGDTKVSGNAEEGKLYKAEVALEAADPDHYYIADSVLVTSGTRAAEIERDENELEKISASLYYSLDPGRVILVAAGGFPGGSVYSGGITSATGGLSAEAVSVRDSEGKDVTSEPLGYNTEYTFDVTLKAEEGASVDENTSVALRYGGQNIPCDVSKVSDSEITASFTRTTSKLKVDTSSDNGLIAEPSVVEDIPNGSDENVIREKIEKVKVKVKTVDGNITEIPNESVYWDTDDLNYDINSLAAAEFGVSGTVTLPDHMDANGSSRKVKVTVRIKQGGVATPKSDPIPNTYFKEQKLSLTSATSGAAIRYTINGGKEKTYSEPIALTGKAGKAYIYDITAYATRNGVKSKTKTLHYNISLPDSGTVSGLKVTCKSRKFTVKWKKNKKADGYQSQYKLKTAKKWTKLSLSSKVSVKTKKLKKGKKYQFRVRTYVVIGKEKYYGKWTKAKTVKCKK